jgi:hypothetical protein
LQAHLNRRRARTDEFVGIDEVGDDGLIDGRRDGSGVGRGERLDAERIQQAVVIGVGAGCAAVLGRLESAAEDAERLAGLGCERAADAENRSCVAVSGGCSAWRERDAKKNSRDCDVCAHSFGDGANRRLSGDQETLQAHKGLVQEIVKNADHT